MTENPSPRKNAANVGDISMSLIYTCALNEVNPADYLTELLRHVEQLTANPADWLPWNYRQTLQPATTTEQDAAHG